MTYRVVLTDRAAGDLEAAYLWIARQAPETAVRWYNAFLGALETLSAEPQRCPIAAESRHSAVEIRHLLHGRQRSYRALFTIQHDTVVVLHIRHTARREAAAEDLV